MQDRPTPENVSLKISGIHKPSHSTFPHFPDLYSLLRWLLNKSMLWIQLLWFAGVFSCMKELYRIPQGAALQCVNAVAIAWHKAGQGCEAHTGTAPPRQLVPHQQCGSSPAHVHWVMWASENVNPYVPRAERVWVQSGHQLLERIL